MFSKNLRLGTPSDVHGSYSSRIARPCISGHHQFDSIVPLTLPLYFNTLIGTKKCEQFTTDLKNIVSSHLQTLVYMNKINAIIRAPQRVVAVPAIAAEAVVVMVEGGGVGVEHEAPERQFKLQLLASHLCRHFP